MNNQYFKRLTIIDELYDNDTIVDYYIRFDGKKYYPILEKTLKINSLSILIIIITNLLKQHSK
jgi:hypothetical protein